MRFLNSLPYYGLFVFALLGLPAAAQTVKPSAAPPKLTLAQALSALPPPTDGLRLTVGADKTTLPDGTDPPPAGASLQDITAAFNDITVSFNDVAAVAPASMVLLNPSPGPPDIAADMSATTALSLLAASLTDAQWAALTSEHGLGLSDLTDDTQRSLFHALFTGGHLYVGSEDPALADLPQEKRSDVRDDTDQIDAVRVRLGQTAHLYLHSKTGGTIYFSGSGRPDAAGRLHTYKPKALPLSAHHAVSLRAEAPNTLKPSDLDWDSKALQVSIPIAGLKTVGDLVTCIGQGSGLKLYANPHYAAKALTFTGPMTTAPAKDLLRAVCVCVTGTFRRVGPAYVLTDDLIGVGIRRKHLQDWESQANYSENSMRSKLAPTMLEHHAADVRKLKAFGDPLGLTQEEATALTPDPLLMSMPGIEDTDYPFAKLPPSQQAWMKQRAEDYEEKRQNNALGDVGAAQENPDFTHDVSLRMNAQLQFLVPTESQAVDTGSGSLLFSLFYPDEATMMAMLNAKDIDADEKAKALAKLPPPPPLSPLLRAGQRRAVLAHPYSAAEVDALILAMQKLGLNQLWLNVFSGGASHIKTSAAYGTDILTEALNKTRGTGIEVYAHLNLLTWGIEPPESVRDLTIDGKDSRQEAIEDNAASPYPNYDDDDNPIPFVAPSVTASPAAPAVQQTLSGLMQDLAAKPELAGVVWEDAGPGSDLGYTPAMRLAFLRAAHADPVDIADPGGSRIDLSLPLFDDPQADAALPGLWTKFTAAADLSLLQSLRAAAWRPSGPPLTILLQQTSFSNDDYFVDWSDPKQPPSLREQQADGFYVPSEKIAALAKTPGRIVLRRETLKNDRDSAAAARKLKDDAKRLSGSGFVLDFPQESETQGLAPLDTLVDAVAAEKHRP